MKIECEIFITDVCLTEKLMYVALETTFPKLNLQCAIQNTILTCVFGTGQFPTNYKPFKDKDTGNTDSLLQSIHVLN